VYVCIIICTVYHIPHLYKYIHIHTHTHVSIIYRRLSTLYYLKTSFEIIRYAALSQNFHNGNFEQMKMEGNSKRTGMAGGRKHAHFFIHSNSIPVGVTSQAFLVLSSSEVHIREHRDTISDN
jgi:hypothetical protein